MGDANVGCVKGICALVGRKAVADMVCSISTPMRCSHRNGHAAFYGFCTCDRLWIAGAAREDRSSVRMHVNLYIHSCVRLSTRSFYPATVQ